MLFRSGAEGKGLAIRWAHAGHAVALGSRSAEKAQAAAAELNARLAATQSSNPHGAVTSIRGQANPAAAADAEVVVLAVPFAAQRATVEEVRAELAGKILIDVSVPLDPENPRKMKMPAAGSATEEAQALFGDATKVVAAL